MKLTLVLISLLAIVDGDTLDQLKSKLREHEALHAEHKKVEGASLKQLMSKLRNPQASNVEETNIFQKEDLDSTKVVDKAENTDVEVEATLNDNINLVGGGPSDCGCGTHSAEDLLQIIGGDETLPGRRPYQAYVRSIPRECSSEPCARVDVCGATLVNKRYALTAGHCVNYNTKTKVVLGGHFLDEFKANESTETLQVFNDVEVIRRDDFENILDHDIAILKLKRDAVINDHVRPACLPTQKDVDYYAEKEAVVSGWGLDKYGGSLSEVLKETSLFVMEHQKCVDTVLGDHHPGILCAHLDGSGSCQGDSGGPFVFEFEEGRMILLGVVSYGEPNCSNGPGTRSVFTRVTEYLDWIHEVVKDGWCD